MRTPKPIKNQFSTRVQNSDIGCHHRRASLFSAGWAAEAVVSMVLTKGRLVSLELEKVRDQNADMLSLAFAIAAISSTRVPSLPRREAPFSAARLGQPVADGRLESGSKETAVMSVAMV